MVSVNVSTTSLSLVSGVFDKLSSVLFWAKTKTGKLKNNSSIKFFMGLN
jgi:hypothetical protein